MNLDELLAAHVLRTEHIAAAYEAASTKDRSAVALVEYRCPSKKRCLVLTCWQSPMGRLVRLSGYKVSEALNDERSSPSGRAKNTRDGNRKWLARHLVLDDLVDWGDTVKLDVNCDHLDRVALDIASILADAATSSPGRPLRRVVSSGT